MLEYWVEDPPATARHERAGDFGLFVLYIIPVFHHSIIP